MRLFLQVVDREQLPRLGTSLMLTTFSKTRLRWILQRQHLISWQELEDYGICYLCNMVVDQELPRFQYGFFRF